jgi:hypothetical protein
MTANYPEGSSAASLGGDVDTSSAGAQGSSGAKEQAKQAAGTAADETKHVAGVAQGEAQRVASEAKSQVQGLVGQATSQVEDQSRTQLGRLAETLRSFGDDLEKMASQSEGPASGIAHEVADRTRGLSSHLEGREPRELLEDVRRFARRKPGAFLLGALAAGVVAGRLTRGAKAAQDHDQGSGYPTTAGYSSPVSQTGPSGPAGPSGTAYPSGGPTAEPYVETGGLPNPAASVAGSASYTDVSPGGRG